MVLYKTAQQVGQAIVAVGAGVREGEGTEGVVETEIVSGDIGWIGGLRVGR